MKLNLHITIVASISFLLSSSSSVAFISGSARDTKMAPIKIEKYFLPKIQFHFGLVCQRAKILNLIYGYELDVYFNNLRRDALSLHRPTFFSTPRII